MKPQQIQTIQNGMRKTSIKNKYINHQRCTGLKQEAKYIHM